MISISKILVDRIDQALENLQPSDKILIATREYPLNIRSGDAKKIELSIGPGVPTAPQVLQVIMDRVPVKRAEMLKPEEGADLDAQAEIKTVLGDVPVKEVNVYQFYDDASDMPVQVAFGSGEMRQYANVLITVGGEEKASEDRYKDF